MIAFTPSRFVSKQSHNSPVIVTASSSASGNFATNSARAAGSLSGCFHSANGTETARLSGVAAFRFAPPMSSPKIVGGIVSRKIQVGPMPRYLVGIDLGTTNIAVAYVDTASQGRRRAEAAHVPRARKSSRPGRCRNSRCCRRSSTCPARTTSRRARSTCRGRRTRPTPSARSPATTARRCPAGWCRPRSRGCATPASIAPRRSCRGPGRRTCRDSRRSRSARVPQAHRRGVERTLPNRKPADQLEEQTVVLTVPASFDDVARNLTAEAAKQAGLKHVTLLEEPQAAFYAGSARTRRRKPGCSSPGCGASWSTSAAAPATSA